MGIAWECGTDHHVLSGGWHGAHPMCCEYDDGLWQTGQGYGDALQPGGHRALRGMAQQGHGTPTVSGEYGWKSSGRHHVIRKCNVLSDLVPGF